MLRMNGGTFPGTSSSPRNITCFPVDFTPARSSTSRRRGPLKRAVPTAPFCHWTPGTCGTANARPFPAHSRVFVTACCSILVSSGRVRFSGFSTSPPTLRRHSLTSKVLGSCMWLRTKKCSTGVMNEFAYSTGISKSRNRCDRTIIPSLPGIATLSSVAQLSTGKIAPAAPRQPETPAKNSRREIMVSILAICFPRIDVIFIPISHGSRNIQDGTNSRVHVVVAKCFFQCGEFRLARAVARRNSLKLILVVQHTGDAIYLRIRCLDLVQPAEQDLDVGIDRIGLLQDAFHAGMRATHY